MLNLGHGQSPLWCGSQNHHRDLSPGYGRLLHNFGSCAGGHNAQRRAIPNMLRLGLYQSAIHRPRPQLLPEAGFITPHCPQQNGMVERVIQTLKEHCIHRQRFDSIQHAIRTIGDWIRFYNTQRPHQALDMKTPAEAFTLAA
ncbi:integrase core domain-containing protein [Gemmobacter lanyuensis]